MIKSCTFANRILKIAECFKKMPRQKRLDLGANVVGDAVERARDRAAGYLRGFTPFQPCFPAKSM